MIVDCFTFFNEMELLEIRLEYLSSLVDKFILVEANKTHAGRPKPFYFNEQKERYRFYQERIINVLVDDMPPLPLNGDRWLLENYQREAIMAGLRLLNPPTDAYIMVSDVDEIPRRELVEKQLYGVYDQVAYMYYLNTIINEHWPGTVGMSYERLLGEFRGSPQLIRNKRNFIEPIRNGGWHWAWLGGPERIKIKLQSFGHSELDNEQTYARIEPTYRNRQPLWAEHPLTVGALPDFIDPVRYRELIYAGDA